MSNDTNNPAPNAQPAVESADRLLQRIDDLGVLLLRLCYDTGAFVQQQQNAASVAAHTPEGSMQLTRLALAEPGRWFSLGRTDLQKGLTALRRSIEQPTGF